MRSTLGILMAVILPLTCVVSMLPGQQSVAVPRRVRFAGGASNSPGTANLLGWWALEN